MNELNYAKSIIKNAEDAYIKDSGPSPCLLLDNRIIKKHNLLELENELKQQNYTIIKLENAPLPYRELPLKNKYIIYKNF